MTHKINLYINWYDGVDEPIVTATLASTGFVPPAPEHGVQVVQVIEVERPEKGAAGGPQS